MLSLTAWPDLRGLGSLKARDGSTHQYGDRKHEAEANPSGVAPARTQPTRAALRGRGGGRPWCALVAVAPVRPSVPLVACLPTTHLANRIPSPLPQPHTSGTRREAYRHARASAGRTSGGGCAGASERAEAAAAAGRGEAAVPRFGSSRWRPSCRSHPSPASRGGGSRQRWGEVRALALARVLPTASRGRGERERESGGGRLIIN
jgi:hypothetical protein